MSLGAGDLTQSSNAFSELRSVAQAECTAVALVTANGVDPAAALRCAGTRLLSVDPADLLLAADSAEARLNSLRDQLRWLKFEAEAVASVLALRVPGEILDGGPLFWRDLVDELVTPWVGLDVDLMRPDVAARRDDWMLTLGRRLAVVRCAMADIPAVTVALEAVGFAGAIAVSTTS